MLTLAKTETFRQNTGLCYQEGNLKLGTGPSKPSSPHFLLLFISCTSVTLKPGAKLGSQSKCDAALRGGRCCVWTHRTQGSTRATFLQGGEAPLSPSLPLNAGVTLPALKTSSWPQSGRHVAAGLTKLSRSSTGWSSSRWQKTGSVFSHN